MPSLDSMLQQGEQLQSAPTTVDPSLPGNVARYMQTAPSYGEGEMPSTSTGFPYATRDNPPSPPVPGTPDLNSFWHRNEIPTNPPGVTPVGSLPMHMTDPAGATISNAQPISIAGDITQLAQHVGTQQPPQPDLFDQAKQQYPILNNPDILYKYTPRQGPEQLEAWPPTETGTPDRPRPSEFPSGKYGIEVYNPKTRPIDVLGDVVSHFLVHTDPTVKDYYSRFSASISPEQESRLREQYQHAQKHEGERRPYEQWREQSGLPAYFRGYPFQQWPKEFNDKAYTPEQKRLLDDMMKHLEGDK